MFLNVCGLKSKLRFPDFNDFIMGYDIVLLTETKLDEMDSIVIPGFNIFTKNRKLKKRKSGGVALLLNNKSNSAVEIIDSDIKETLWFRLKEHNTKEDNVFIVIYNPPQDSRYADPDIFSYIENHVVHLSKNPKTKFC